MPTGKYDRTKSKPNSSLFKKGHIVPKGWRIKFVKALMGKTGNMARHWKGGKTVDKRGYILIYRPSHPYCNNEGYVREHRLIVENCLGRYLNPRECVHHINGITKDNRIGNLKVIKNNSTHLRLFHAPKPFARIIRECKSCKKEFNAVKSRIKGGRGIYCSWKCYKRYGLFTV